MTRSRIKPEAEEQLTDAQYAELIIGYPWACGAPFASEEEKRAAWARHKHHILKDRQKATKATWPKNERPIYFKFACRPWAWWKWEAPFERLKVKKFTWPEGHPLWKPDDYRMEPEPQWRYLDRHGLLTAGERRMALIASRRELLDRGVKNLPPMSEEELLDRYMEGEI